MEKQTGMRRMKQRTQKTWGSTRKSDAERPTPTTVSASHQWATKKPAKRTTSADITTSEKSPPPDRVELGVTAEVDLRARA